MEASYTDFLAEDFARDPWFREWIVGQHREADVFWREWMKTHPGKQQEINRAVALLRTLEVPLHRLSSREADQAIADTLRKIRESDTIRIPGRPAWTTIAMRYAASVMLLIGLALVLGRFYWNGSRGTDVTDAVPAGEWIVAANHGNTPKNVVLPDGSEVLLDPAASLKYHPDTSTGERVTYLEGSAFFKVTRNPSKPFLVYTDDLVTKVLGTSFRVNTRAGVKQTVVSVVTGKVAVSPRAPLDGLQAEPVVLLPNQEIVYKDGSLQPGKALVEIPEMLPDLKARKFVYEDIAIGRVFDELEAAYGIRIRYDKELLRNCQVTATLGDEPFKEKLDLVCKSIRASFEETNGEIVISSRGCNY